MSSVSNEEAKELIISSKFSCVVTRNEELLFSANQRGISPLIDLNDFDPSVLNGSHLFDKIIGKAAAMIAVNCSCSYVYGLVMSESAIACLKEHGIPFEYTQRAEIIKNRDDTGMCPIEMSVKDISDIKEGCKAIRKRWDFLKSKASL